MKSVELLSYVAQQIQSDKKPSEDYLSYLKQIRQKGGREAELIKATIESLDVPQLERLLRKRQINVVTTELENVPGKRVTLYKAALPAEAQARVAADSLIARYLSWLARSPRRRAVTLAESDRHVVLFVPEGSDFDPIEAWYEFIRFAFSTEELVRTFVAMLNSIKLSDRGFGVPEFPILSGCQEIIILAWLLRSVQLVQRRLQQRQSRITELETAIQTLSGKNRKNAEKEYRDLREKQDKEMKKYGENFSRRFSQYLQEQQEEIDQIDQLTRQLKTEKARGKEKIKRKLQEHNSKVELTPAQLTECAKLMAESKADPLKFLSLYEGSHGQVFKHARALGGFFTERAAGQINLHRGDNFASAIVEITRLVSWREAGGSNEIGAVRAIKFPLRPLLVSTPEVQNGRLPGDGTGEFCYVCGELLSPKDESQVNRFVFRSPSQRLQSVRGEQRPAVCRHCVAIAFASPLKPSDQSVIIRLESVAQDDLAHERSIAVLGKLESFLRGLTLSQLDISAGNYLMLTSSERVKVGKNWRYLADVVGGVVYAHLRLAQLFDHQVFADYKARIVTGISDIQLESHRLAFLSILTKALQLPLTKGSDVNRPLASTARYTLNDEPVLAIYELVSQPNIDQRCRQERARIEIEKSLEVWTKMIGENRAKIITDVVAMAGLLYPFVDQTLREVCKKTDTNLDPDREASKLIEEVDEVFNFIYRFADNTAHSTVRLYRNPTNWFTYEQTKALLTELSIDVKAREKTETSSIFLEVNTNDVEAAYKKFAEKDYKADADWRAFTYRLKLALYSRFPRLGVKKEKPQ